MIRIGYADEDESMTFHKEAAGLEIQHMTEIVESAGGTMKKAAGVAVFGNERRPAASLSQKG